MWLTKWMLHTTWVNHRSVDWFWWSLQQSTNMGYSSGRPVLLSFSTEERSGMMGDSVGYYVFQSPCRQSVDHQWMSVDCSGITEIILEHSWMDLWFNFCSWDRMDKPQARGVSLNKPLNIRGQLGQSSESFCLFTNWNSCECFFPHGHEWSSCRIIPNYSPEFIYLFFGCIQLYLISGDTLIFFQSA